MSEFELRSLTAALQLLKNENYITEEERKILFERYKEDKRKYFEVHEEIKTLRFNRTLLKTRLNENKENSKLNITSKDGETSILGTKVNVADIEKENNKIELNLENVTDFEKEGKYFIKLHITKPEEEIRIIENRTDPYFSGKEILEDLKKTYGNVNLEGIDNAALIFKDILLKKCIEIEMKDEEELSKRTEFDKLTLDQQKKFYGLKLVMATNKVDFENKKVYVNLDEELVIIATPDEPTKDQVRKLYFDNVEKKYKLVPVKEFTYKNNSKEFESEVITENKSSLDDINVEVNTPVLSQEEDDLEKELKGATFVKRMKNKKNKNAAFINIFLVAIVSGVLIGMALVYAFDLLYK